ncbi:MAG TPA: DinB family protein [Dehalococcoidia bacterium]|nr:DinB family protein [Dehalococcoidia bacterium]
MAADAPTIVSAALMVRPDGYLLLAQHPQSHADFGGLWSLPLEPLPDDQVAEEVLARLLSDRFHVQPGPIEFADTIYFNGAAGGRYIVNVFACHDWQGEPRFAKTDYEDAGWVAPGNQSSLALIPELEQWLPTAFEGGTAPTDSATLIGALTEARDGLIAAYDAVPVAARVQPADGEWTPLDVLAHSASVEVYYAAESQRLLEVPGHTWSLFNDRQWNDEHRTRPTQPEAMVRARLDSVRERTLTGIRSLDGAQLEAFGNHPTRGVVTVGERIDKITVHDREHAAQLHTMNARGEQKSEDANAATNR